MASSRHEAFRGLPIAVTERIFATLPTRHYAAGETLLSESQPNDALFFIEDGEVGVWKGDPGSKAGLHLATFTRGDCCGEMSALKGQAATASVLAIRPTTVRMLRLADLPTENGVRAAVTLNLAHPDLLAAIAAALSAVTQQDALGWFAVCGYNFILNALGILGTDLSRADTLLPLDAAAVVARFVAMPGATVATFRLRFDQPRLFLRLCAWFTRFDTVWTRFGDQGILISREAYAALGGFPAWPLFEDVALLRAARRLRPVFSLPAAVTTSARRFARHGHLRQQLRNALLLRRFLAGESPHRLATRYARPDPSSHRHESTLV